MWRTKTFKTADEMKRWLDRRRSRIRFQEIAVNNAYGVIYCPIKVFIR